MPYVIGFASVLIKYAAETFGLCLEFLIHQQTNTPTILTRTIYRNQQDE